MSEAMKKHEIVIRDFLTVLNKETDVFILKGGTALRQCYNLNRFSEDIDLDGIKKNIIPVVERFAASRGYKFRIGKDSPTVKRCLLQYDSAAQPLKIEVSYRRKQIAPENTVTRNGIRTYTIDQLAKMKSNAYSARDKIRDLYDLVFICKTYFDQISKDTKDTIAYAVEGKGIEQFEYLTHQQKDPLIQIDQLETDFLNMYDKLGLLTDKENTLARQNLSASQPSPHESAPKINFVISKPKNNDRGMGR